MELKELIKNAEYRSIDYKNMLEDIYKNKNKYSSEFIDYFIPEIRELKNDNQRWLKEIIEEQTYVNQGLNIPQMYNFKNLKKK